MNQGHYPSKVIIPIRGVDESMSRLRNTLNGDLVNEVVFKLFMNTVNIVLNLNIEPIILTSDHSLLEKNGIRLKTIIDDGSSLNKAVSNGIDSIDDESVLFVMPDLPGLTLDIMKKFLGVQSIHKNVIAPTHDRGTAIACLPSHIFKNNLFGKSSADLFIEACNKSKIAISVFETENISHDLDTIEDWIRWESHIRNNIL